MSTNSPRTAWIIWACVLYTAQGKFKEAESFHRQALDIRRAKLGPVHLLVAQSLENYADLLIKTGRAGEAKRAQILATSIRETVAWANQAAPAEPGKKAKPAVRRLVVPG